MLIQNLPTSGVSLILWQNMIPNVAKTGKKQVYQNLPKLAIEHAWLMATFLTMTIQADLCWILQVSLGFSTKFTQIVVINYFAHHSHFLAAQGFLGAEPFLQLGCFGTDIIVNRLLGLIFTYIFFFSAERRKESRANILFVQWIILLFALNCTN